MRENGPNGAMKPKTLEFLICPACLPEENSLSLRVSSSSNGEITDGNLECGCCKSAYAIRDGVARLLGHAGPVAGDSATGTGRAASVYESPEVLSEYL